MRRRLNAEPQAIDPASGFQVPYRNLVKQYDGEWVDRRFVDKRNPQDFLRARRDNLKLDHPRPGPSDLFLAENVTLEDGFTPIICEDGTPLMTGGELNGYGVISDVTPTPTPPPSPTIVGELAFSVSANSGLIALLEDF